MNTFDELISRLISGASPEPKVFGVGGSPRKKGNSDILLNEILKGVTDTLAPANRIQLRDLQFQGCVGCERCRKDKICTGLKDGMTCLYPDILESQGLVLVSPTHNYNITAWMKAFIDRLYCFYTFDTNCPRGWASQLAGQKRKAVIAAVCEQENKKDMGFTLDAMRLPLEALGYEIVGELAVFKIFDRAKVKEDSDVMSKAVKLGLELGNALK